MRGMLHHLTCSLRGPTQFFEAESLRFGTGNECDVRFSPTTDPQATPAHAELILYDHAPNLRNLPGQRAFFIKNRRTV